MMIHKGEKPHECKICQKKFREKSYYNLHMKKHIQKNNKKNFKENKKLEQNDLVMDKRINDFYIKLIRKGDKPFDNNSSNSNNKENNYLMIENKNDFKNKEIILNSENYDEKNNLQVFNDLNNSISLFKLNSQEEEKNFINENEICNFTYQNENISFSNAYRDLYDFSNMNNEPNKYNNFYNGNNNNTNYYDELYIKDIYNISKLGIVLPSDINEIKNKIEDDHCKLDFPLNF